MKIFFLLKELAKLVPRSVQHAASSYTRPSPVPKTPVLVTQIDVARHRFWPCPKIDVQNTCHKSWYRHLWQDHSHAISPSFRTSVFFPKLFKGHFFKKTKCPHTGDTIQIFVNSVPEDEEKKTPPLPKRWLATTGTWDTRPSQRYFWHVLPPLVRLCFFLKSTASDVDLCTKVSHVVVEAGQEMCAGVCHIACSLYYATVRKD